MSFIVSQPPPQSPDFQESEYGKSQRNALYELWFRTNKNFESISSNFFDNIVIVKSPNDLSGVLDSTKEYFIDGIIDMGSQTIQVPESGLNLKGYNFDNSGIISNEDNYTMFSNPDGGVAGYLRGENIFFNASGVGSKVFDLNNNQTGNSVEFTNCNFGQFGYDATTSLGVLTDYRLFRLDGCAVILTADGVILSGTMSGGVTITDTIALLLPSTHTLLKEGVSLVIDGSVNSNMNFNSVNSATEFCDFLPSVFTNDSSFNLSTFRTTASDPIPNISNSNVKVNFKNVRGLSNTYIGGEWVLTTEATTTISTTGVFVKLEGTTTYSDMQHWSNETDNAFIYDSSEEIDIKILATLGLSGGNNDQVQVQIRLWDNSSSTYVIQATSSAQTLSGGLLGRRAENIVVQATTTVNENDRIEIWVANISDTTNLSGIINSKCVISERA